MLIGSPDAEAARKAIEKIESLTKEVEIGTVYTGKVTRIFDFGAMVEVLPGKEGLVHISELADHRVGRVEDEVNIGDEIMVKAINIDNLGRVNLSRRAVFENASEVPGDRVRDTAGGNRPYRRDDRRSGSRPPRYRSRPPIKGGYRER